MTRTEKTTEMLQYVFTEDEKRDLAGKMARTYQERQVIEEQKKAIMAQLKGDIDRKDSELSDLTRKLNNGHEFRAIECVWQMNEPFEGQKQLVRLDTGEVVRSEQMTVAESQEQLFPEGAIQ